MEKYVVTFITTFTYGVKAESEQDAADVANKLYVEELQGSDSGTALYDADAVVKVAEDDDSWLFDN